MFVRSIVSDEPVLSLATSPCAPAPPAIVLPKSMLFAIEMCVRSMMPAEPWLKSETPPPEPPPLIAASSEERERKRERARACACDGGE